jgi:tetratricopeptide (TPR) repeat protein
MDEQTQTGGAEQGSAAVDPGDQPLSPDEEIAEIEKLLSTEADDFQARCRLGELYFSKGRLDDALTEVKKSIEMAEGLRTEMNRSLAMYYSNLGTIYATKGMIDEAEAEFKRALDVHAYDVLALFNLGRVQADKRKYMESKNYYERLVEITPTIRWRGTISPVCTWSSTIHKSPITTPWTWRSSAIFVS